MLTENQVEKAEAILTEIQQVQVVQVEKAEATLIENQVEKAEAMLIKNQVEKAEATLTEIQQAIEINKSKKIKINVKTAGKCLLFFYFIVRLYFPIK